LRIRKSNAIWRKQGYSVAAAEQFLTNMILSATCRSCRQFTCIPKLTRAPTSRHWSLAAHQHLQKLHAATSHSKGLAAWSPGWLFPIFSSTARVPITPLPVPTDLILHYLPKGLPASIASASAQIFIQRPSACWQSCCWLWTPTYNNREAFQPHCSALLWAGEQTTPTSLLRILLGMSAAESAGFSHHLILISHPKYHFQAFPSVFPGHNSVFYTPLSHHRMPAVILVCY